MDPVWMAMLVVVFALLFDLSNGWNDSANAIATVVSTRVLRPGQAVALGAVMNFVGALVSSEVAKTVGKDIADPTLLVPATFLAAVMISPAWIALCTWKGLPISCSHSLMGGLIGAVLATTGPSGLKSSGIKKIVFGVFTSPFLGFAIGLALMIGLLWIVAGVMKAFPRVRPAGLSRTFGLSERTLAYAKPDAIVMHPGPINRGVELSPGVADGPRAVILQQVSWGVAIRMAVLERAILGDPPTV